MELINTKVAATLPPLYATQDSLDPVVQAKLFTPWGGWSWLLTEYDPEENMAFGYAFNAAEPQFAELGYISITELEEISGPFGLKIERDLYFDATPLSQAKESLLRQHGLLEVA